MALSYGHRCAALLVAGLMMIPAATSRAAAVTDTPDARYGTRPTDEELATFFNRFIDRLEPFGFHGTVLAARGGRVLTDRACGLARLDGNIPNRPGTLFSTGSVTKQFTAAAILRLEMEGRLSTTDPITRFFDKVPDDKSRITIHHLLTHTAGLRPIYGDDDESIPRDDLMRVILDTPLAHPIGDQYDYSNAGYSMLAAIIEIATGVEYERYLRDTFFLPNGMTSTGLELIDAPDEAVAHSHNEVLGCPSPAARPDNCWNLKGNGGILSTTGDMYRWCTALREGAVLSSAAKTKMFTPHIAEYEADGSWYGYGWVIDRYDGDKTMIWHNGGAMPHGWSCAVYWFVPDDAVVIVFSNKPMDGMLPVDRIAEVFGLFMTGRPPAFPPEIAGALIDNTPDGVAEGMYAFDGGLFEVVRSGSGCLVSGCGQAALDALFPSAYAAQLSKYNARTSELVAALAARDFDRALEYFDLEMATPDQWRVMAGECWTSLDTLGGYEGVEALGTAAGDGAQTYSRIHFAGGSVLCRFGWMGGKCGGMTSGVALPARMFHAQGGGRFVSYSLPAGDVFEMGFRDDGALRFVRGEYTLIAVRPE